MVLEGLSLLTLKPRSWVESSLMKPWMAGLELEMRVMSSTNTEMMILKVSLGGQVASIWVRSLMTLCRVWHPEATFCWD